MSDCISCGYLLMSHKLSKRLDRDPWRCPNCGHDQRDRVDKPLMSLPDDKDKVETEEEFEANEKLQKKLDDENRKRWYGKLGPRS